MRKTFEFRLYPSKVQVAEFERQLALCARLYNAMLEQRILARELHVPVNYFEQKRQITGVRAAMPEYDAMYVHVAQDVALRVERAFQAFFRRVKSGESPGFPRFRSVRRYDSLMYPLAANGSVKVAGNRVSFSKLAKNVRMFQHRPIQGVLKTATVKRKNGKWFVLFSCDEVPPAELSASAAEVGVDMGLEAFATLSTGERVERALSRRKKGSTRRSKQRAVVASLHERVANQRKDFLHKEARKLINRFGRIAFEDLRVQNMVKNRRLARSISDASWSMFVQFVQHKAAEAGAVVVLVDPKNTSQVCSACSASVAKKLSDRWHSCPHCGYVAHRDENAALNILQRARMEPSWRDYVGSPEEARSPAL